MTTKTKEEALDLLEKFRKGLLNDARNVGVSICQKKGTVHSRAIYHAMRKEIDAAGVTSHFLGGVFRDPRFEWTGRYHEVPNNDPKRHGGDNIKLWRLKQDDQ
jgi:hypothetical protein